MGDETRHPDEQWMDRALALAKQGIGLASPNPTVGCVLINPANEIVGEGFHQYDLRDHAEVVALQHAGEHASRATAYVTLEPCSHHGRTGPCADALINAGVSRVVVATLDANPVVRGKGVGRLRAAGIDVEVGLREYAAQRLNDAFAKVMRTALPWVTLKVALSRDGYIAPPAAVRAKAEPVWLTGPESRAEVHRMRHAHDALLTGAGTILADDPWLTDRSGLSRRRALLRVILDSQLRTPAGSKLLKSAHGDVLILTRSRDAERIERLRSAGALVESAEGGADGISLRAVLEQLGGRGILSVMIEGGTRINTAALDAGFVDGMVLFESPVMLGAGAVPFVLGPVPPQTVLEEEREPSGSDFRVRKRLHTYWEQSSMHVRNV